MPTPAFCGVVPLAFATTQPFATKPTTPDYNPAFCLYSLLNGPIELKRADNIDADWYIF